MCIRDRTNTDSFKSPDKYFAIEIDDKKDIIIDGCNSTFVIHGDMCAFATVSYTHLKIRLLYHLMSIRLIIL